MLDLLPKKINDKNFSLVSYCLLENKEDFLLQMNKYRNLFRKNFGDTSFISLEESRSYLEQFHSLNKTRVMFAIFFGDILVGQYGLKMYPGNYVLLDYAVRFKPLGPRDLFSLVSKLLILELKALNESINIFIAIKPGNLPAQRLHSAYGHYEQMDESFYIKFGMSQEMLLRRFSAFI